MSNMNKALVSGNLGNDPEVRYTPAGTPVANFRIATNETWNDKKSGKRQDRTEWHRIVAWGKTAEIVGEYLTKGREVTVEGRLKTRQWDDRDGVKRYTTEIHATQVYFHGKRSDAKKAEPQSAGDTDAPNLSDVEGDVIPTADLPDDVQQMSDAADRYIDGSEG